MLAWAWMRWNGRPVQAAQVFPCPMVSTNWHFSPEQAFAPMVRANWHYETCPP